MKAKGKGRFMLLLHISDIHFKSPQCLNAATDPDRSIRTRIMLDLQTMCLTLGPVGSILIGGDVAFKADPDEYATALAWIEQLAAIVHCPIEMVFVVPGNHDVDRSSITRELSIQNAQLAITAAAPQNREWKLRQQLGDAVAGQALFKAHSAYNEFAARFDCQIYPEKPFWRHELDIGEGVGLAIYGLTSTLLSGQDGADDVQGTLYLSPLQTTLDPAPNKVNLALLHHPVDWLFDGDDVEDALVNRAALHLFGHKHRQRIVMANTHVKISAGAANPSRSESPYEPGYNLIDLAVHGEGEDRSLHVAVHQRKYQSNPERFVAIENQRGQPVFRTAIPVPAAPDFPLFALQPAASPAGSIEVVIPIDAAEQPDAEVSLGLPDGRELLYRFWNLTSSQRRQIASTLGLLEQHEHALPEPERYRRALMAAAERRLMARVESEIQQMER